MLGKGHAKLEHTSRPLIIGSAEIGTCSQLHERCNYDNFPVNLW
jgi:hypothetical protein